MTLFFDLLGIKRLTLLFDFLVSIRSPQCPHPTPTHPSPAPPSISGGIFLSCCCSFLILNFTPAPKLWVCSVFLPPVVCEVCACPQHLSVRHTSLPCVSCQALSDGGGRGSPDVLATEGLHGEPAYSLPTPNFANAANSECTGSTAVAQVCLCLCQLAPCCHGY